MFYPIAFPLRATLIASALCAGLALTSSAHASTSSMDGVHVVPPVDANSVTPKFKRGRIVDFRTRHKPGSIVIVTRDNALYYVLGSGKAAKYRVATAKPGFGWSGIHTVCAKVRWPDWRPPQAMRKRRPELPSFMEGGPGNPLGARALYLGSSIYRIHGTNEPASIGKAVSSGCIRMLNADVSELFRHVKLGATVSVV